MRKPFLIVLHQEHSTPGRVGCALAAQGFALDIRRPRFREEKPFLGICLGAQMMVRQLGGKVGYHPEGQVEGGYYPIRPTEIGTAMCGTWPDHVYQWHREGFDLPRGSELIAEGGADFPVQAFRHGPCAYGIQFHPEVNYAMMCRWTTRGHARMELPGAKARGTHFADRAVHDLLVRAW